MEDLDPVVLQELIANYAARMIGVLVLLFVAWLVSTWVRRITVRGLEKASFDPTLTKFFGSAARWAVLLLAGLACLGVFGVQTTSFAALIGAGGIAIGLAFQGTLSNFAAGLMLLIFRPFKVGQSISVAGQKGKWKRSPFLQRSWIPQTIDASSFRTDRSSAPPSRTSRTIRSAEPMWMWASTTQPVSIGPERFSKRRQKLFRVGSSSGSRRWY